QVAAVAQVRSLRQVRAFSPTAERRQAFARRVTEELGIECRPVASAGEAVAGADVLTLVTRATEPVLTEPMVEPGVHVNAVGAIDLARREFEPGILRRCATVATDSLAQVRNLSSEFRRFFGDDVRAWARVRELGELVVQGDGRRDPSSITMFKGMGSGVEDLALGVAVLERLGSSPPAIERGGRAKLRLRPSTTKSARAGS
ncbi:MAG: ornithine cyclodeaminase family protein, partial [Acidimicrobiales bacterium]